MREGKGITEITKNGETEKLINNQMFQEKYIKWIPVVATCPAIPCVFGNRISDCTCQRKKINLNNKQDVTLL